MNGWVNSGGLSELPTLQILFQKAFQLVGKREYSLNIKRYKFIYNLYQFQVYDMIDICIYYKMIITVI